ncbi:MAG: coenzyme F420 hydrogenase/dehydrogenase beta subunit N-terminal domain-containing protein [Planctomycetota bacterium]|nr:coenzyme F420 hydrogenase/dehydrogenase beta subunit N-terminal domain-containing protein [Planctomycetota bacterium]
MKPPDDCRGCGVCAGLCPHDAICMQLSHEGYYRATIDEDKCTECGLCEKICPSRNSLKLSTKEDSLGQFNHAYVGHSKDSSIRNSSASGGCVTSALCSLLDNGEVGGCIVVHESEKSSLRFEPCIATTKKEVIAASGSKYYPVEFSGVLREAVSTGKKYALVGLPCVCQAIANGKSVSSEVRRTFPYVYSLVCGKCKTTHFTEGIAYAATGSHDVDRIRYRTKGNYPLSNYRYLFEKGTKQTKLPFTTSPIAKLWGNKTLTLPGCHTCNDTFGIGADAAFMDAWASPYSFSTKGYNFVLTKGKREELEHSCELKAIDLKEVLQSQDGVLRQKLMNSDRREKVGTTSEQYKTINTAFNEHTSSVFSPATAKRFARFIVSQLRLLIQK